MFARASQIRHRGKALPFPWPLRSSRRGVCARACAPRNRGMQNQHQPATHALELKLTKAFWVIDVAGVSTALTFWKQKDRPTEGKVHIHLSVKERATT